MAKEDITIYDSDLTMPAGDEKMCEGNATAADDPAANNNAAVLNGDSGTVCHEAAADNAAVWDDATVAEDKTVCDDVVAVGDAIVLESDGTIVEDNAVATGIDDVTQLEGATEYDSQTTAAEGSGDLQSTSSDVIEKGATLLDLYRIDSNAIEGGMGRVFRVHHTGWNTDLAMKQPKAELFKTERQKENFIHECESWINLGLYPHIVSCYYVREINRIPTIFSEWMDGGSLKNRIDNGKLYEGTEAQQLERILDISIQFARGLHYAHEQGLIHQDVKPDNLLLNRQGEAKVADFGIAKARATLTALDADVSSGGTMFSKNGGKTPAYCSIEQMNGEKLTRRTDVWSWAVSVLEMFLGDRPWPNGVVAGTACEDYFDMARIAIPDAMKVLLRECFRENEADRPHDFAVIESKLLEIYEASTGNTYARATPKAAADTTDSLNNKALSFMDMGKPEEAQKCWERAVSIDPNHVDSVFNLILYQWRNGQIQDNEAVDRMKQNAAIAGTLRGMELIARLYLESGNIDAASQVLKQADEISPGDARLMDVSMAVGSAPSTGQVYKRFCGEGEASKVYPCGNVLISVKTNLTDTIIKRWDIDNGALLQSFTLEVNGKNAFASAFDITPDGVLAITLHDDKKVRLWDIEQGKLVRVFKKKLGSFPNMVHFSPDGEYAVSTDKSGTVLVWDVQRGECIAQAGAQAARARFYSDQCLFYTEKDEMVIWNIKTGQKRAYSVTGIFQNANMCFLYTRHEDGTITVQSLESAEVLQELKLKDSDALIHIDASGRFLYTADWHGTMKMWDIKKGRCLRTLFGEDRLQYSIDEERSRVISWRKFSQEASFEWCISGIPEAGQAAQWQLSGIATVYERLAMEDKFVGVQQKFAGSFERGDIAAALRLCNEAYNIPGFENSALCRDMSAKLDRYCKKTALRTVKEEWAVHADSVRVMAMCFSKDGKSLFTGGSGYKIMQLDANDGACMRMIDTDEWPICVLRGIGSVLYAGNQGKCVAQYDISSGRRLDTPGEYEDEFFYTMCDISPDGRTALIFSKKKMVLMDLLNKTEKYCNVAYPGGKAVYSPDGQIFLARSLRRLELIDVNTGDCIKKFNEKHRSDIGSICFRADGKIAVSTSIGDNRIFLWNIETGESDGFIESGFANNYAAALSLDGKLLLVCAAEGFELWGTENQKCLFSTSLKLSDNVFPIFSPDGRWLVINDGEGMVFSFGLDYEYQFPGFSDWDEGARPYLEIFLTLHPKYNDADFDRLIEDLQNRGCGWLRSEGIRAKLLEMKLKQNINKEQQETKCRQTGCKAEATVLNQPAPYGKESPSSQKIKEKGFFGFLRKKSKNERKKR